MSTTAAPAPAKPAAPQHTMTPAQLAEAALKQIAKSERPLMTGEAALKNGLKALTPPATALEVKAALAQWRDATKAPNFKAWRKAHNDAIALVEAGRKANAAKQAEAKATATAKPAEEKPKREPKAKTPAKPKREYERVVNQPGLYCKQRRIARRSGTVVSIWDLAKAPEGTTEWKSVKPAEEGEAVKYVVMCEDHTSKVGVKSYERAWRKGLTPGEFCPKCAEKK